MPEPFVPVEPEAPPPVEDFAASDDAVEGADPAEPTSEEPAAPPEEEPAPEESPIEEEANPHAEGTRSHSDWKKLRDQKRALQTELAAERAETARVKAENEQLKSGKAPAATTPTPVEATPPAKEEVIPDIPAFDKVRPQYEDFSEAEDPLGAYTEALSDWNYDRRDHQKAIADRDARKTQLETRAKATAEEQAKSKVAAFNQASMEFKKEQPDFQQRLDAVAARGDLKLSPALQYFIFEKWGPSPELAYEIAGMAPEEQHRINSLPHDDMLLELNDLKKKYASRKAAEKRPRTPPPEPPASLRGNGAPAKSSNSPGHSFPQFKAMREREEAARRARK